MPIIAFGAGSLKGLSDTDLMVLLKYVNPVYLNEDAWPKMQVGCWMSPRLFTLRTQPVSGTACVKACAFASASPEQTWLLLRLLQSAVCVCRCYPQAKFSEDGSIQLHNFLKRGIADRILQQLVSFNFAPARIAPP